MQQVARTLRHQNQAAALSLSRGTVVPGAETLNTSHRMLNAGWNVQKV